MEFCIRELLSENVLKFESDSIEDYYFVRGLADQFIGVNYFKTFIYIIIS
jgi:hypothetical protein